jgi:hypothetical protein
LGDAFKDAPDMIKELARLALHSQNDAVRVSAAKELLDRALGKAVQAVSGEDGEGPLIVQVITGVPRAIASRLRQGHPELAKPIFAVMRANTSWDRFYRSMQRALPKQNANLELNLTNKEGEPL